MWYYCKSTGVAPFGYSDSSAETGTAGYRTDTDVIFLNVSTTNCTNW
jgi:hypothetical protein